MLSDRVTAVDSKVSTGNEVRRPLGQVHACCGDFLRLTPPASRRSRKNLELAESDVNRFLTISPSVKTWPGSPRTRRWQSSPTRTGFIQVSLDKS